MTKRHAPTTKLDLLCRDQITVSCDDFSDVNYLESRTVNHGRKDADRLCLGSPWRDLPADPAETDSKD